MKPQKVISLYEQEMLADPEFDTNLAPKVSFQVGTLGLHC
jgi:hypothetical protein